MEWAPWKCLFWSANDSFVKLMVSIITGVSFWYRTCYKRCPDNCSPRKIDCELGLGFGSRLGLVLALGSNQTIAPKENCPLVRARGWFRVRFWVGGQISPGAIVLEPFLKYAKLCKRQQMLKTYDNLKVDFVWLWSRYSLSLLLSALTWLDKLRICPQVSNKLPVNE